MYLGWDWDFAILASTLLCGRNLASGSRYPGSKEAGVGMRVRALELTRVVLLNRFPLNVTLGSVLLTLAS